VFWLNEAPALTAPDSV